MDFRALAEATQKQYRPICRSKEVKVEKVIRLVRKGHVHLDQTETPHRATHS